MINRRSFVTITDYIPPFQLVGCSKGLGENSNETELITLPISTDALVRTEIWTNDPKSTESYVTLKPYCQLDGCLQNLHFVETGAANADELSSRATDTFPKCHLLLQHHQYHSLDGPADVYALTTETTSPTSSISILDPITGSRIFVPPFTANAGFLVSSPSPTAIATVASLSDGNTERISAPSTAKSGEGVEETKGISSSMNQKPLDLDEPT